MNKIYKNNRTKKNTNKSKKKILDSIIHKKNQINQTRTKWLSIKRPIFKKRNMNYTKSPPVSNCCCVCGNKIKENVRLNPNICYQRYRDNAHRLCLDCWFKPNGFASEQSSHPCPGCTNNVPYWKTKKVESKSSNNNDVIDLS
jgi:hypothetical protein